MKYQTTNDQLDLQSIKPGTPVSLQLASGTWTSARFVSNDPYVHSFTVLQFGVERSIPEDTMLRIDGPVPTHVRTRLVKATPWFSNTWLPAFVWADEANVTRPAPGYTNRTVVWMTREYWDMANEALFREFGYRLTLPEMLTGTTDDNVTCGLYAFDQGMVVQE